MTESNIAAETGAVRLQDGKVEVFDGERWGPYRPLPATPGVRPQCRCMNHNHAETKVQ